MQYKLSEIGNDVIVCEFDSSIEIDAKVYSVINHNTDVMVPCMRSLEGEFNFKYDVLGTHTLSDELNGGTFTKNELYSLILLIMEGISNIIDLGVKKEQIVLNPEIIRISDYDNTVRFICLPTKIDDLENEAFTLSALIKTIAISVRSEGAYEIVGLLIELAAEDELSPMMIIEKINEVIQVSKEKEESGSEINILDLQSTVTGDINISSQIDSHATGNTMDPDVPCVGKEYIPMGMPILSESVSEIPVGANKTQLLFGGEKAVNNLPYLLPVENNSESARIYLVGIKLIVGRSSECDIRIEDHTVSGKHAELRISGTECYIVDLHSTNKTYLNGKPISPDKPEKLKNNDLIAFNKRRYRFIQG